MIDVEKRKVFGEWLRSVRKQNDLSLNGAARRLGYATKGTLIGIECGQASIPVEKIHPIAELYGIALPVLLEKLRECEPDLYEKFLSLERNFFQDFTKRLETLRTTAGARSSVVGGVGPDGESIARHHSQKFTAYILSEVADAPSIISCIPPEYYQMEQMQLDLQPMAARPRDLGKLIPLFPDLIKAA